MRNAFRDFFRARRVARHVRSHGDVYIYCELPVVVPASAGLGVRNSLLRGRYELDEAAMIEAHLGTDLPVIELGGSLGVVSRLIRSRIGPAQRHIVVEANPAIAPICAANAARDAAAGATEFVCAAVAYGAPTVRFAVHRDIHSSGLAATGPVTSVEVPTVSLKDLVARLGAAAPYALVSDIEGGEFAIFERESEALAGLRLAILEIHPDAYAADGRSTEEFMALAAGHGLRVIDRQADVLVLRRG